MIAARQRVDRGVLAEDDELEVALQVCEHLAVRRRHVLRGDARDAGDHGLDVRDRHRRFALGRRLEAQRGARLVHHVDRLVRQVAVVDVALRELRRRDQRVVRIGDAVVLLEARPEPAQDVDRLGDARLDDVDLLEAARERVVLLEDAAVFLVGGRADAAQLAVREQRLDQVRGVHDAARGGARADHRVDLVDEEDRARLLLELADDALEPLLEVAAVLGPGDQGAHVERVDRAVGQHVRDLLLDHEARQAFGNRSLADAGFADVKRVVLAAAAEDLDGALHLELPADQRVHPPGHAPGH